MKTVEISLSNALGQTVLRIAKRYCTNFRYNDLNCTIIDDVRYIFLADTEENTIVVSKDVEPVLWAALNIPNICVMLN